MIRNPNYKSFWNDLQRTSKSSRTALQEISFYLHNRSLSTTASATSPLIYRMSQLDPSLTILLHIQQAITTHISSIQSVMNSFNPSTINIKAIIIQQFQEGRKELMGLETLLNGVYPSREKIVVRE
jgi:hypothetical protein